MLKITVNKLNPHDYPTASFSARVCFQKPDEIFVIQHVNRESNADDSTYEGVRAFANKLENLANEIRRDYGIADGRQAK